MNAKTEKRTSRTADAAAAETGLCPNVLKWPARDSTLAISGVVTTAPIGKPLAIDLAIVTIRVEITHPYVHRLQSTNSRTDVGHDVGCLEAPVVGAGAPEAGLHLVRDAHAAHRAHLLKRSLEEFARVLYAVVEALCSDKAVEHTCPARGVAMMA